MTTEEAIKTLESRASTGRPEENYSDFVFGASIYTANEALDMAIAALRAQRAAEKGCEQCSGIVYRQSCSGKIVPLEQRCGSKIMPPCYRADGDGCAYQIYGEDNDEPIDCCKRCPLCYSDKIRRPQAQNDPLTLEELREMNGEPVYIVSNKRGQGWCIINRHGSADNKWTYFSRTGTAEGMSAEAVFTNDYGKGWLAFRHKPKEV